jgi:DNA-binding MarR family transcriptional regulator
MDSRESRVESIVDDLRTVYASVHRQNVPAWLQLDLTMAQFKALVAVERSSGVAVCELGRKLGIGESAASLLVDQLVRRGYVGRKTDRADRRRVHLAPTSRGTKLLGELRQGRRQSLKEWLADVDDDDLDGLARGLGALTRVVSAGKPPAAGDTTTEVPKT